MASGRQLPRDSLGDLFHQRFFVPLFEQIENMFGRLRWIQQGALQFYVLYIALTLVGLLVWELY